MSLCGAQNPSKINGFSVVAEKDEMLPRHFDTLKTTHANYVALTPFAFGDNFIPRLEFDTEWQWSGETTKGIAEAVRLAHNAGLKVMLKPQIWLHDGSWIGDLEMLNENEWLVWQSFYADYIIHFAQLADSLQVDLFCIGTELSSIEVVYDEFFISLIDSVRHHYDGSLTYAANWDSYENITFWNDLDFIGVDAYFPCDSSVVADVDIVSTCLQSHKKQLALLSQRVGKPILFTEFGYRSVRHCAGNQWDIIASEEKIFLHVNDLCQLNAYRAFFKTFWSSSFIAGGFIWKWHPRYDHPMKKGNDYSPQKKPALKVIKSWYEQF
ncbi:MAG: glycoside hydrolase [Salibacteraceae bacterium]